MHVWVQNLEKCGNFSFCSDVATYIFYQFLHRIFNTILLEYFAHV